jgi:hypothetical protein
MLWQGLALPKASDTRSKLPPKQQQDSHTAALMYSTPMQPAAVVFVHSDSMHGTEKEPALQLSCSGTVSLHLVDTAAVPHQPGVEAPESQALHIG